jgi:hypothetical protein
MVSRLLQEIEMVSITVTGNQVESETSAEGTLLGLALNKLIAQWIKICEAQSAQAFQRF